MTDAPPDPHTTMHAAASSVALAVPDACVPGVIANMALLAEHAAGLAAFALPDDPSA